MLFWKRISEMVTMRLSLFLVSALARPEDFLGTFMVRPAGLFPVSSLDRSCLVQDKSLVWDSSLSSVFKGYIQEHHDRQKNVIFLALFTN